jgi:hypothetical protein
MSYLAFENFDDLCTICIKAPQQCHHQGAIDAVDLNRQFPFLEYASKFWSKHLYSISAKGEELSILELDKLTDILCDPKSAPFRVWFPIYWFSQCTETWERKRYPEYPTELIVHAFLGNEKAIRSRFRWSPVSVDECTPAGEEWTPLMAAAWMGNRSVVDLLLEHDAGYAAGPEQNARALVYAIERGHLIIAQKLVTHFTKIQSTQTLNRLIIDSPNQEECATPLLAAVRNSCTDLVEN